MHLDISMYKIEVAKLEKFADIFGGVLRVFLDTWLKVTPTYEAFYLAAENGHVELVRWILQKIPHYRVHPNETLLLRYI